MIETSDENFQENVIETSKKISVVVDLWASWCMPCTLLGPILEKLEKEYQGKFLLAKLNVDKNPKIAEFYKIMSIPTVKMFKNGKLTDGFIGAMSESLVRK